MDDTGTITKNMHGCLPNLPNNRRKSCSSVVNGMFLQRIAVLLRLQVFLLPAKAPMSTPLLARYFLVSPGNQNKSARVRMCLHVRVCCMRVSGVCLCVV